LRNRGRSLVPRLAIACAGAQAQLVAIPPFTVGHEHASYRQ
jgi:hypothetical protein